jgi:hypothetical protein
LKYGDFGQPTPFFSFLFAKWQNLATKRKPLSGGVAYLAKSSKELSPLLLHLPMDFGYKQKKP